MDETAQVEAVSPSCGHHSLLVDARNSAVFNTPNIHHQRKNKQVSIASWTSPPLSFRVLPISRRLYDNSSKLLESLQGKLE